MSSKRQTPSSTGPQPPCDALVLAAVDRASRHGPGDGRSAPPWAILDHLAIAHRSAHARHVRARLAALLAAGLLERSRRHGVWSWGLTDAGRAQLRAARRSPNAQQLPEAPQHRAWREARTLAAHEIDRFSHELAARLHDAQALLDGPQPPPSDRLFQLGQELRLACRRLGAAAYCLYEWPEPVDQRADHDSRLEPGEERLPPGERELRRALRAGRRNLRQWRD